MDAQYLELYSSLLESLEQIVRKLIETKFRDRNDLWHMELDLINYQLDIQEKKAEERRKQQEAKKEIARLVSSKNGEWRTHISAINEQIDVLEEHINIYDYVHKLARRFGDAIAWVLFNMDTSKIFPLNQNEEVRVLPGGYGTKGTLMIAEVLANAGAGFPIIHDMTNILRIGDITFVPRKRSNGEPYTVEVKTQLLSEEAGKANLNIRVFGTADFPEINIEVDKNQVAEERVKSDKSETANIVALNMQINKRLGRQLARMSRAKTLQTAEVGQVLDIDNDPRHKAIKVDALPDSGAHHWDVIRDLIIEAKAKNYAARTVDDTFYYAVIYAETAQVLMYPWRHKGDTDFNSILCVDEIIKGLSSSPMWFKDSTKNHMGFQSSWTNVSKVYPLTVPFFLYPLPPDSIIDMLWGRLMILVFVNLGKLVDAVNKTGLIARLPTTEQEYVQRFIPIFQKVETLAGTMKVELHSPHLVSNKLFFEYLSLEGFVSAITGMMSSLELTLPPLMREVETNE